MYAHFVLLEPVAPESFTLLHAYDTDGLGIMRSTLRVTGSPFLNTSCGFFTRRSQLTCRITSPSSFFDFDDAPNSAMLAPCRHDRADGDTSPPQQPGIRLRPADDPVKPAALG